MKVIPDTRGVY